MHLFNTRMANGILYELDMRLRPSGNSGLLWCILIPLLIIKRMMLGHGNIKHWCVRGLFMAATALVEKIYPDINVDIVDQQQRDSDGYVD